MYSQTKYETRLVGYIFWSDDQTKTLVFCTPWYGITRRFGVILSHKSKFKVILAYFNSLLYSKKTIKRVKHKSSKTLIPQNTILCKKDTQAKPSIILIPFEFQDIQSVYVTTRCVATVKNIAFQICSK